jgi:hypothetical protein
MTDETTTHAPWTADEVDALNRWQSGPYHPFTCAHRNETPHRITSDKGVLVASEQGWSCPDCDYTQNWAHRFMVSSDAL